MHSKYSQVLVFNILVYFDMFFFVKYLIFEVFLVWLIFMLLNI